MKKKVSFLLSVIALLFTQLSFSQNKYTFTQRANIRIGSNYIFQNGSSFTNITETGKGSLQGYAFAGYRFDPAGKSANYFGVFGSVATIQSTSVRQMETDQALTAPLNYTSARGYLYELEGGFIFGDWFRLSAGPGIMRLPVTGSWEKIRYFNGSAAIMLKAGVLNLNMITAVQFGGDIKKTSYRAGIGAGLNFKFLNARKKY